MKAVEGCGSRAAGVAQDDQLKFLLGGIIGIGIVFLPQCDGFDAIDGSLKGVFAVVEDPELVQDQGVVVEFF